MGINPTARFFAHYSLFTPYIAQIDAEQSELRRQHQFRIERRGERIEIQRRR